MWMNDYDIADAYERFGADDERPNLAALARTLRYLETWTNQNSDGWSYWPKPSSAAKQCMKILDEQVRLRYRGFPENHADITPAEARAALRPIKAFRTRYGADFTIVSV